MEKNNDVFVRILELCQTGLEGLEHIHKKTMEGQFEETAPLFRDVFSSFREIDNTLQTTLPQEKRNLLLPFTLSVVKAFKVMMEAYKQEQNIKPLEVLQFTLLPYYRKWVEEIEACLKKNGA